MEKEKYILSSKNEIMPFKSFTMYRYQLIKFVMKQLQPFLGGAQISISVHLFCLKMHTSNVFIKIT